MSATMEALVRAVGILKSAGIHFTTKSQYGEPSTIVLYDGQLVTANAVVRSLRKANIGAVKMDADTIEIRGWVK